jgi:hypothetical protein
MENNANFDLIKKLSLEVSTELWKYAMTTRNIKKQDLLIHHYNIAFNVFRKWFEQVKVSGIKVAYSEGEPLMWSIFSGKVEYMSHGQSLIKKLCKPDQRETQQAIEHLNTGYQ